MSTGDFESLIRSIQQSALPVDSLDEDAVRALIATADLIWGYDPRQEMMPLFYGRELLEEIARGREEEFDYQALLCFTLDLTTEQPQQLCNAVESLKGSCCFAGGRKRAD